MSSRSDPRSSGERRSFGVTDLHVHLEGSLFPDAAAELVTSDHPWAGLTGSEIRKRFRFASFAEFLAAVRDMCLLLRSAEALASAAKALSVFLSQNGIEYAEVYHSPHIFVRWGMEYHEVLDAVEAGFEDGERRGGARCMILLDTVRQWGAEPAEKIVDEQQKRRKGRVIGFGIGGDETVSLVGFQKAFEGARVLGLGTVAHAGEHGPASDVADALDCLGVDRIAHGIRALDDPGLINEIRSRGVALDLAVTSNYRTKAVSGTHPIRYLIDAGVAVTLGTDDPSLFRTDPIREFRRARRFGRLDESELTAIARSGIEHSFATDEEKRHFRTALSQRIGTPY